MDIAKYKLLANKPKAKYRNTRCEHDGVRFDSLKERARWLQLLQMAKDGQITNLERQVAFPIEINGIPICKYYADHVYQQDGKKVVEDTKSIITRKLPVYRLKKKLLKAVLGLEILES